MPPAGADGEDGNADDCGQNKDTEPCTSDLELIDQNFQAVKAFCLQRQSFTFQDVQRHFSSLPTGVLERCNPVLCPIVGLQYVQWTALERVYININAPSL